MSAPSTLDDQDYETRLAIPAALPHQPAVPAFIAFAFGIVSHRYLEPRLCVASCGLVLFLAVAACFVVRHSQSRRSIGWLTLACLFCLGAVRHYSYWSVVRSDEVSHFATDTAQPVRLVGRISNRPAIRYVESKNGLNRSQQVDQTSCYVECKELSRHTVTGRSRLTVRGHLTHASVGDLVEIHGTLVRPAAASNPGEFDYREYLRRQGVRCMIRVTHPEAISVVERAAWWDPWRAVGSLRRQAQIIIDQQMSNEVLPVASAILLGNRDLVGNNLRTSFVESGTMHLLAISGLHVAILAWLIVKVCQIIGLSSCSTSVVLIACVGCYAMVTEARPPVLRASILISIAALGRPMFRRTSLNNLLAIAGIVLLVWNPTDLFDVGARLSFLAVAGIALALQIRPLKPRLAQESLVRKGRLSGVDRIRDWINEKRDGVTQNIWMMVGIALMTAPLVAREFHVVSPIGLVITVGLIVIVAPILWCGYLMLFCGFLVPPLAPVFGWLFEQGMAFILWVAKSGADVHLGHYYVKGPESWWLIGHFSLAIVPLLVLLRNRIRNVWLLSLLVWMVFGLLWTLTPVRPNGVRCTFNSVGHGLSIFVETPNGRSLLYDCGTMGSEQRAFGATSANVWARGYERVDVAMVSHADLDHFNGLPEFFDAISVGQLLTTNRVATQNSPTTRALFASAKKNQVDVDTICRGDRLLLDPTVKIEILHPEPGSLASSDNADSVTLLIEFAGRRILLTGDLEEEGLAELLRRPSPRPDIMLSPHHGSRGANTNELAAWSEARWVVASCDRNDAVQHLPRVFDESTVLTTALSGAISFEITPDGEINVETFHSGRGVLAETETH